MKSVPTDDKASRDIFAAAAGAGHRLVALYRGEPPQNGATSHNSTLVAINVVGDVSTDARVRIESDRSITKDDRIIELDHPVSGRVSRADDRNWLLIRHRSLMPGARLLVVEDNAINGDYYREVLAVAGAEVVLAPTASAALELAAEDTFDLALIDVRLPDANGYELSRLLGSLGPDRILPSLLMSADPTTLDSARVTSVGASGFVVNPVRPDELVQTVATALTAGEPNLIVPVGRPTKVSSQQPILRLFGRAAVWSAHGWTDLPAGRSADILATLAAACPESVSAERLSRLVWDRNLTVSANAMYTAISRLRRQLEGSLLAEVVVTDGLGYRLAIDPESIDLVAFERRAQEMIERKENASTGELGDLLGLWIADPFTATTNELLVNWRHRLRGMRAQTRELLAVRLTIADRAGEAGQLCRELVLDEPWRESAWSLLIVALYRSGRQNDALNAHRAAVLQLRRDLGLDPGPGLASLEMKVLQHDDSLLDDEWLVRMATSLNRRRSA
ncbi:MAG: response regulator [Acidimicrobiia bacterium]|nr:response regulator [Acidimicrobiia bacterium]